ncbi:hypothetical protein [Marinagarivorans cellulosilyticus]|uniref:Uncharacterized protein n=1 Tax=Marinagarivorans cellulosilyticus TaxID=2721545 RepID=A0AAN1WF72_9GAMM|nr:hypothetical protein [Marinagarivorans cellulosilyticus]BCD96478.1 hypothetical protein MARGE09_P0678 [Marinagarivorans cellulosilyticus]
MNIEQAIQEAFFPDGSVPIDDEFIEENADIAWLNEKMSLLILVPSYMLWCTRNRDSNGNLVVDGTVNALAEYGRSKKPEIEHLSFKFLCNSTQREVVLKFLQWCLTEELLVNEEQVQRACKHWG